MDELKGYTWNKKVEEHGMFERRPSLFVNFLVRAIVGITLIFFLNQFFIEKEMEVNVGINPVTFVTSGALGVPGVALLYGISIYEGM